MEKICIEIIRNKRALNKTLKSPIPIISCRATLRSSENLANFFFVRHKLCYVLFLQNSEFYPSYIQRIFHSSRVKNSFSHLIQSKYKYKNTSHSLTPVHFLRKYFCSFCWKRKIILLSYFQHNLSIYFRSFRISITWRCKERF